MNNRSGIGEVFLMKQALHSATKSPRSGGYAVFYSLMLLSVLLLLASSARAERGALAEIEPQEIGVGEVAQLTVHVGGSNSTRPVVPNVEGLTIQATGQSSEIQIINGSMSSAVNYSFAVRGERRGNYTIPAIPVIVGGKTVNTQPLAFRVTDAPPGGSSARRRNFASPFFPEPDEEEDDDSNFGFDKGDDAPEQTQPFIKLSALKKNLYLGETMPVEIKVYFPPSVGVRSVSQPAVDGDAFAIQNLKAEPQQGREAINGQLYTILQWNTALSAVKEGDYQLKIKVPAVVLVREKLQRRRRSLFGSGLLDDDFAENFFGQFLGLRKQKEVQITSAPQSVVVQPLPAADRPVSFTGAVGRFAVSASASPLQAASGDPITVRITVKGRGNFDRVEAPVPTNANGWKTYKPSSSFQPLDSVGYEGKKEFEQVFSAVDAGVKELPSLQFSYFDTRDERYVTVRTDPIPVSITPSLSASVRQPQNIGVPKASGGAEPKKAELVPISVEQGDTVASLTPLIDTPVGFGLFAFAVLLVLAGGGLNLAGKARAKNPLALSEKETRQKVNQALAAMEQALTKDDSRLFFASACRAAQERLAAEWRIAPEAITSAELKERLPQARGLIELFQKADAIAYSGEAAGRNDLLEWKGVLLQELKTLPARG